MISPRVKPPPSPEMEVGRQRNGLEVSPDRVVVWRQRHPQGVATEVLVGIQDSFLAAQPVVGSPMTCCRTFPPLSVWACGVGNANGGISGPSSWDQVALKLKQRIGWARSQCASGTLCGVSDSKGASQEK